ncbi:MAG: hypothetical protein J7M32_05110, partial [Deltaproteobacteria bacterium]|nr:hypothetical protein [Deltaproteobacteria bacterium]
ADKSQRDGTLPAVASEKPSCPYLLSHYRLSVADIVIFQKIISSKFDFFPLLSRSFLGCQEQVSEKLRESNWILTIRSFC